MTGTHEFEIELDDKDIDYIREHGPLAVDLGDGMVVQLWIEYDKVAGKEFLRMTKVDDDD